MNNYIPYISGFTDFCKYHSNGEPIYFVRGRLYAGFDMLVRVDCKYNFTLPTSRREVERAIVENLYMFDVEETQDFYFPNTNMFSKSNEIRNIKGYVLKLKKKYN